MSDSLIFDQLQAEFVEKSKYIRLQIGPLLGEGFERVEVINEYFGTTGYVHRLIEVEVAKPRLYIVEGAPELVNLDETMDVDIVEEIPVLQLDDTMVIPKFKHEKSTPPSIALNDTMVIPIVKDEHEEPVSAPQEPDNDNSHVVPIKKVAALHKTAHRKISATGTLSWFTNNRAA